MPKPFCRLEKIPAGAAVRYSGVHYIVLSERRAYLVRGKAQHWLRSATSSVCLRECHPVQFALSVPARIAGMEEDNRFPPLQRGFDLRKSSHDASRFIGDCQVLQGSPAQENFDGFRQIRIDADSLTEIPEKNLLPYGLGNGIAISRNPNAASRKGSLDVGDNPFVRIEHESQKTIFLAACALNRATSDRSRLISILFVQKIH